MKDIADSDAEYAFVVTIVYININGAHDAISISQLLLQKCSMPLTLLSV